jgi:hypothetical protein
MGTFLISVRISATSLQVIEIVVEITRNVPISRLDCSNPVVRRAAGR